MRFAGLALWIVPFLTVALTGAGGFARAQDRVAWGPPTAPFAAEMVFRDARGQERKAQLYYTPERQRLEYLAGQEPVALLVDEAAGKSWLLLLNRRQYRSAPHQPVDYFLGVSNPTGKRRVIGEETVLGRKVTKMEVTAETRTGDRFQGLAWATQERIVVRLRGSVTRGQQTQEIEMAMTRLDLGPVDPALLAVPSNYKVLPPSRER